MKKLFITLLSAGLLLTACKNEQKPATAGSNDGQPVMTLSSNDTTTVRQQASDFLQQVVDGKIDEAVAMLYFLDGDTPKPLTNEQRQEFAMGIGAFTFKGFKITSLVFKSELDTEVGYNLYLDDPSKTSHPRTFKGLFRPVRRNGAWYITLANGFMNGK